MMMMMFIGTETLVTQLENNTIDGALDVSLYTHPTKLNRLNRASQ
jgi:hypothetical protein